MPTASRLNHCRVSNNRPKKKKKIYMMTLSSSSFFTYISWTTSTPPWLATSTWPRLSGTVCSLQLQARRPILMLMTHLCALIVQPSCTQTEVNHNCNCSPLFLLVFCTSCTWTETIYCLLLCTRTSYSSLLYILRAIHEGLARPTTY